MHAHFLSPASPAQPQAQRKRCWQPAAALGSTSIKRRRGVALVPQATWQGRRAHAPSVRRAPPLWPSQHDNPTHAVASALDDVGTVTRAVPTLCSEAERTRRVLVACERLRAEDGIWGQTRPLVETMLSPRSLAFLYGWLCDQETAYFGGTYRCVRFDLVWTVLQHLVLMLPEDGELVLQRFKRNLSENLGMWNCRVSHASAHCIGVRPNASVRWKRHFDWFGVLVPDCAGEGRGPFLERMGARGSRFDVIDCTELAPDARTNAAELFYVEEQEGAGGIDGGDLRRQQCLDLHAIPLVTRAAFLVDMGFGDMIVRCRADLTCLPALVPACTAARLSAADGIVLVGANVRTLVPADILPAVNRPSLLLPESGGGGESAKGLVASIVALDDVLEAKNNNNNNNRRERKIDRVQAELLAQYPRECLAQLPSAVFTHVWDRAATAERVIEVRLPDPGDPRRTCCKYVLAHHASMARTLSEFLTDFVLGDNQVAFDGVHVHFTVRALLSWLTLPTLHQQ